MQDRNRDPNLKLSDGLYRLDHPDSDLFLSRPLRSTSVATLGDYYEQLRQVSNECNQSSIADKSNQSYYSERLHPVANSNTSDNSSDCDGGHHDRSSDTDNDNFQHVCVNNPIRICNCSNTCADSDFEPTKHTEGQNPSTWTGPCVVIGCTEQASSDAIQLVPDSGNNAGYENV